MNNKREGLQWDPEPAAGYLGMVARAKLLSSAPKTPSPSQPLQPPRSPRPSWVLFQPEQTLALSCGWPVSSLPCSSLIGTVKAHLPANVRLPPCPLRPLPTSKCLLLSAVVRGMLCLDLLSPNTPGFLEDRARQLPLLSSPGSGHYQ